MTTSKMLKYKVRKSTFLLFLYLALLPNVTLTSLSTWLYFTHAVSPGPALCPTWRTCSVNVCRWQCCQRWLFRIKFTNISRTARISVIINLKDVTALGKTLLQLKEPAFIQDITSWPSDIVIYFQRRVLKLSLLFQNPKVKTQRNISF